MNHLNMRLLALCCVGAASTRAQAWEFRCRFIERVGNQNVELPGNTIDASDGAARNIRVQFGAFDDADGPAPVGGFVGWNVGSIAVGGPAGSSDERRNAGRIAPFTFAAGPSASGSPPLPDGDPFTMLTEIDCTLGTQSPIWLCGPDGIPPPMPPAIVRGLNTFVSVYAFSIDPRPGATTYDITLGGNLIAASEWRVVSAPPPPDCEPPGPEDPPLGSITYAPLTTPPRAFSCTLTVVVPSPTSAALSMLGGGLVLVRRRRVNVPRAAAWVR